MKTISKALAGSVVAGAMAISAASPAFAADSHGFDRGDIRAGEMIAGALVLGGIAAATANASHYDRDYDFTRAGYRDRDGRYGRGWNTNPREAVAMCVRRAENAASRRSFGGRADVTDVRDVRNTGWGYEVRGRIAVNTMGRGWRHGDNRYGYGWNNDYRGWNDNLRGFDSGRFTCRIERGRVVSMDFQGIRGL